MLGLLAFLLAGCSPNPNALGVTDTGTVTGRLVDARTPTQPIQQAVIAVGTQTYRISPSDNGAFTIPNVPVGTQTVSITSIGYQPVTLQVVVRKDQTTDISVGNPGAVGTAYGLAPTGG
jgi:starvation-inducible outer membrane lipoprotein